LTKCKIFKNKVSYGSKPLPANPKLTARSHPDCPQEAGPLRPGRVPNRALPLTTVTVRNATFALLVNICSVIYKQFACHFCWLLFYLCGKPGFSASKRSSPLPEKAFSGQDAGLKNQRAIYFTSTNMRNALQFRLSRQAAFLSVGIIFLLATSLSSCKKEPDQSVNPPPPGNTPDTTGTLRESTRTVFPNVGMAVTYDKMATTPAYLATVKREVNNVTFGNELKEGFVTGNGGAFDYTTADALYTLCAANGLEVFGHTLVWHSQQNVTYLKSLINGSANGTPGPDLLAAANGSFEAGSGNSFSGWNNLVNGSAVAVFSETAGNNSTRALRVAVTTPGANAYDIQSIGPTFNVTSGHTVQFSIDLKASVPNGKVRVVVQNNAYLQYDITPTTSWATYRFSLVVNEPSPSIRLNFPASGEYSVDHIVVNEVTPAGPLSPSQASAAIDAEMKRYITTTMNHYAGKIKAWDVANEVLVDNGALRTSANHTIPAANQFSEFLYGDYLGTKYDTNNYVLKAFQYAKAADPTVLRFINDYNLEYARSKTDGMVELVNFINSQGNLVDGIGTQMHISLTTQKANIDYSFQKLASTGLKIRISELDIALNTSRSASYVVSAQVLSAQQEMYKYVLQSYIKNVPAAQRHGVTVWGVADTDSWINTSATPDAPLLFDKDYRKKAAYAGFRAGLK
jgi:endo-1,4-beta-xylanase